MTTNLTFGGWAKVVGGDEKRTTAPFDRFASRDGDRGEGKELSDAQEGMAGGGRARGRWRSGAIRSPLRYANAHACTRQRGGDPSIFHESRCDTPMEGCLLAI